MSYRDPKRPMWLTRGSGCGCAILFVAVIVGGPLLFARAWSCNHQKTGSAPCDIQTDHIVILAAIVVVIALCALTKWVIDRRDSLLDDEE